MMRTLTIRAALAAMTVAGFFVLAIGCNKTDATGPQPKGESSSTSVAKKVHDHNDWWCDEHGVPEKECSICQADVRNACKVKGDWCDKHDRAKSQCFICDPSLKEKFAKRYRDKYGKEPPEPDGQKEEPAAKK
jgi:hypothetical protein